MRRFFSRSPVAGVAALALTFSAFATLGAVSAASATPAVVTVGSASTTLAGTNIPRAADALVLYTRTATQSVTPTNMWAPKPPW